MQQYYSIGEAADLLEVSVPTIRLYEQEGLIIPYRKQSRHRRFSQADIERIHGMRRLINEEKMSIAGIRQLLALIPCWKIKNCPEEARDSCAAFAQHDSPCWRVSGKSWKCRSAECRLCTVYKDFSDCQSIKAALAEHSPPSSTQDPHNSEWSSA